MAEIRNPYRPEQAADWVFREMWERWVRGFGMVLTPQDLDSLHEELKERWDQAVERTTEKTTSPGENTLDVQTDSW